MYVVSEISIISGSTIAAKLMGTAGGLAALARIPACTIQILGQKKANFSGYSAAQFRLQSGFVYDCDIIKNTPPDLRTRACRLIAGK